MQQQGEIGKKQDLPQHKSITSIQQQQTTKHSSFDNHAQHSTTTKKTKSISSVPTREFVTKSGTSHSITNHIYLKTTHNLMQCMVGINIIATKKLTLIVGNQQQATAYITIMIQKQQSNKYQHINIHFERIWKGNMQQLCSKKSGKIK